MRAVDHLGGNVFRFHIGQTLTQVIVIGIRQMLDQTHFRVFCQLTQLQFSKNDAGTVSGNRIAHDLIKTGSDPDD